MKKVIVNGLLLWQFEGLGQEPSIKHFVTCRSANAEAPLHEEGRSKFEFSLSYSSSPNKEKIWSNRHRLAAALGVRDFEMYFPSQVHKTKIVKVNRNTSKDELMETDALITDEKGICIAVMTADCVPILLYDKKNHAVAAVHSGWRGTVERILEKTLQQMFLNFGTAPEDLIVGIGPSVCQESYEVGEEVVSAFADAFGKESGLMLPTAGNKAMLDLWKANVIQLHAFGVVESQIEISDLCTVKNNHHFFSARKGDTGRFAAGIMLV